MGRRRRIAALAAALLLAAPAAAEAVRPGGTATFLAAADVDYLDPGQTYYTFGYMVQYAVNRPLYSFRPDSLDPVPDLAAGAARGLGRPADDHGAAAARRGPTAARPTPGPRPRRPVRERARGFGAGRPPARYRVLLGS